MKQQRLFSRLGHMKSALVKVGTLTLAVLLLGLLLSVPAHALAGDEGVQGVIYASILCLIPGWIVAGVSALRLVRSPLAEMTLSTMLRLAIVMGAALSVKYAIPHWGLAEFYAWLVIIYLMTLAIETVLFVREQSPGYWQSIVFGSRASVPKR